MQTPNTQRRECFVQIRVKPTPSPRGLADSRGSYVGRDVQRKGIYDHIWDFNYHNTLGSAQGEGESLHMTWCGAKTDKNNPDVYAKTYFPNSTETGKNSP